MVQWLEEDSVFNDSLGNLMYNTNEIIAQVTLHIPWGDQAVIDASNSDTIYK